MSYNVSYNTLPVLTSGSIGYVWPGSQINRTGYAISGQFNIATFTNVTPGIYRLSVSGDTDLSVSDPNVLPLSFFLNIGTNPTGTSTQYVNVFLAQMFPFSPDAIYGTTISMECIVNVTATNTYYLQGFTVNALNIGIMYELVRIA